MVAAIEVLLVLTMEVTVLIELEMLIYALSAALFFYAFVYLRIQRNRKFRNQSATGAEEVSLLKSDVSLDAEGELRGAETYEIGGGIGVAVLVVLFPVITFGANTAINLADDGVVESSSNNSSCEDQSGRFQSTLLLWPRNTLAAP